MRDSLLPYVRPCQSSGIWLSLIVPVLLARAAHWQLAVDVIDATVILFILSLELNGAFVFSSLYAISLSAYYMEPNIALRPLFVLGFNIYCTRNLLRLFPLSFTFGEAVLLSNLLTLFVHTSPLFLWIFVCAYLVEFFSLHCQPGTLLTIFSATLICLPNFLAHYLPDFYAFYKLRVQHLYCFATFQHSILFVFWGFLFLFCIIVCISHTRFTEMCILRDGDKCCDEVSDSPSQSKGNNLQCDSAIPKASTVSEAPCDTDNTHIEKPFKSPQQFRKCRRKQFWIRKVFHFAAGIVFASGLLFSPQLLSTMSATLLAAFGLFEWMRRRGPKQWASLCNQYVDPFLDERDAGALLITPISLLLGLSLPIWWPLVLQQTIQINVAWNPPPSAWSGVLSIALGDSVAALVGSKWGRLRWPMSHRTLLGSTASWLSQLIAWSLLAHLRHWSWIVGFLPITLGVLVEAYTLQIDNLVVPLVVLAAFGDITVA